DEAHAALDEPPCEDAVPRERRVDSGHVPATALERLLAIDAIHRERRIALRREIDELGSGELHPERELVRGDAALDLRIADRLEAVAVELADRVEASALDRSRDAAGKLEMEDRLALVSKEHAFV